MENFWTDNAQQLKTSLARLTLDRVLQGEIINPETLEYLNSFASMGESAKAGIVSTMKQDLT
jgi:hypothetical protein